ncbi:MAG: hypothetical protein IE909_09675, partial [Campylobacterales bacterium]|nr:hypothetical protein [Campylobacterales bacterium]
LYYSVETPTNLKYSFGKSYEEITDGPGKSASVDMCIFERISNRYNRVLTIEFKSGNPPIKHIAKDIKKLICENKDGVFVHLLQNSNSGTFRNNKNTGIFDKYYRSLEDFKINWENYKAIHFILISLKQKAIIHRLIEFKDLDNLQTIFYKNTTCGAINKINGNGWEILNL